MIDIYNLQIDFPHSPKATTSVTEKSKKSNVKCLMIRI